MALLIDFVMQYGLFLAKLVTFVVVIFIFLLAIKSARSDPKSKGELEVTNLTELYSDRIKSLDYELFDELVLKEREKEEKRLHKQEKKDKKAQIKADKKTLKQKSAKDTETTETTETNHDTENETTIDTTESPKESTERELRVFVLDFDGSVDARELHSLREEISAIIGVAIKGDRVILRLESPGGMVHSYGLASSQLMRLKQANIPLTIVVDQIAASGGYMMACVADEIVAAPFSIIGSIGVVAQIPNFHKLLKKNDIEFEQLTAGEYKRTLTVFGENTDKAREKFQEELEDVHHLFKNFISQNRPNVDIDNVATGEHWYGQQALEKGLIDKIGTSDDLILEACKNHEVLEISYQEPKSFADKLAFITGKISDTIFSKVVEKAQKPLL